MYTKTKRKKVLIADQGNKDCFVYSDMKKDNRIQIHVLNNEFMLEDSLFLNTFDLVITDSIHYNTLKEIVSDSLKLIVVLSSKEKHLVPIIQRAQAIVKKGDHQEMLNALTAVEEGKLYVSNDLNQSLPRVTKSIVLNKFAFKEDSVSSVLTKMEFRVMEELIADKTNQQIADTLHLSKRTVEYHLAACMRKLEAKSRVGLAVTFTKSILLQKYA